MERMNPFQKQAISPPQKNRHEGNRAKKWPRRHPFLSLILIIVGLFTLKGVVKAIQEEGPFSVKEMIFSAVGETLEEDRFGNTNILLLGVGGENHEGENLTDTMIVASINTKKDTVSMLSIPRDMYVENEQVGWGTRLNSIYEYIYNETEDHALAEAELEKEIEAMLEVEIHYYAKIDFKGFTEVIDAMEGITVEVTQPIYDTTYPASDGINYETFALEAGIQTLDGETALKYVRRRHGSSDFDRAARQQKVLEAIKDKASSLGVLGSPSNIKNIYAVIAENFQTNMSVSELVTLAGAGLEMDADSIQTVVLNDLAYTTGGFLYTPEREEGDPYYLVPYAGDFSEIARFAQLFFYHPEIMRDSVSLTVLNGTKQEYLAGLSKMLLVRYGFNVVDFGNAESKETENTSIYKMNPENPLAEDTAKMIPLLINGEITDEIPTAYQSIPGTDSTNPWDGDLIIELGVDFLDYYKENENLFYIGFY